MKKNSPVFLLSVLTLIAWYKIIFQMFMGEGYYYFKEGFPHIPGIFSYKDFLDYDVGARILFSIFKTFFRDNIMLYQIFALLATVFIVGLFYRMVNEITDNKKISFISSLLFSINYASFYEMLAIGNYQFFIQRFLWFFLLLPSFTFFVKYFKHKKTQEYLVSVFLYLLDIIFARFSIFFLPIYFCYTFGLVCFSVRPGTEKARMILSLLPYILITGIFLFIDKHVGQYLLLSHKDILLFLGGAKELLTIQIPRQLTVMTVPHFIIIKILSFTNISFKTGINYFFIPIILFYCFVAFFLFFKVEKYRTIILCCVVFIPTVLGLNIFMAGDEAGLMMQSSRYLFVPSIAFAIFWGIFITTIFSNRYIHKFLVICFLVFWIYSNAYFIWTDIDARHMEDIAAKKSLEFIKKLSPKLHDDSFVVIPSILGYHGANFVQVFYGKKNTVFFPMFAPWIAEMKQPFEPEKDYILDFNYNTKKVIDVTKSYKIIISKKKIEQSK